MIIRINLSPTRRAKSQSNNYLVFVFAGIGIGVVALVASFYAAGACSDKTSEVEVQTSQVDQEIATVKSRIADVSQIQQKIKELHEREVALAKLASIRQGPQFVLNEFARLLSNPRDVVSRKEASESGWLLAWEPDNVMLQSFKDLGNSEIQIDGVARSMDDVYEFWTRMKTSKLFRKVELVEIKGAKEAASGEQAQAFSFRMGANFNYQTKEGASLVEMLTTDAMDTGAAKPKTGNDANPAKL